MYQVYLDTASDMEWLQSVHNVPAGMQCAILTGNEDSPSSIAAWRVSNPHYQAPPDWTWPCGHALQDLGL
jgi:hypothetical protein